MLSILPPHFAAAFIGGRSEEGASLGRRSKTADQQKETKQLKL